MSDVCPVVTGDVFERSLSIPADEFISGSFSAMIDGIPVVIVPIPVATKEVKHHVVDEVWNINEGGKVVS